MKHAQRTKLGGATVAAILASIVAQPAGFRAGAVSGGEWTWEHWRGGRLLERGPFSNIVVNEGLDDLLDMTLSGGTPDTSWFVGLKDTGVPAAGDTLASHVSWLEITPYTGLRRAWVDGGVSGQSVDNSASPASFAINATDDVYGAFLGGVDTGSAGRLYAAGDFAALRGVINGDTLNVTATFTTADDGV